jgi:hypothetical protein
LKEKCNWSWTKKNGIYGYVVKSRTNANTIFLPAAGYSMQGSSSWYSRDAHGYYWSSTRDENNRNFIWGVMFDSMDISCRKSLDKRNVCCSIRPVCK